MTPNQERRDVEKKLLEAVAVAAQASWDRAILSGGGNVITGGYCGARSRGPGD